MKLLATAFLCLLGFSSLPSSSQAQAVYSATRKSDIEVGAGVTYIKPDFSPTRIVGASFWGDYNFNRLLGVEVVGHLGSIVTPNDLAQNSIVFGPKVSYHRRKASVYGTVRFGIASETPQGPEADYTRKTNPNVAQSPYGVIAFGGGFEYRLTRKVILRPIDIEQQKWGNFEPHTLSPLLLTFGASYIVR